MSRYLTPSKTTLLLLITIYLESAVPTSATVPVLSFLVTHILPSKKQRGSLLDLHDFETALSNQKSVVTGRSIWDLLLRRLWSLDSADTYHTFFDSLHTLIESPRPAQDHDDAEEPESETRTKLSRTSPLGAFVRRSQIEFTRLTFGDSVLLWKELVAFRQPSFNAYKRRNASASRASLDAGLVTIDNDRIETIMYGDLDTPRVGAGFYSTDDVDKLLDFQVAEMNKTGHRVPEEITRKLEAIAQSQVTVSSAVHYVKFIDAWKAGDYPMALDSLHRYFDYTIQTREKSHYQYALLNMAHLHAHFGCYAEAVAAMQETVATARENKDMTCLNYSLSWLVHFGQAHPEEAKEIQKSGVLGSGKEALAFLRAKAKESGSWPLLSGTLVAEARLTILSGDGLAPAVENLVRASHINLTERVPAGFTQQLAVESNLWTRLGVGELADTKNELLVECYSEGSTDLEKLAAVCRKSYSLAAGGHHHEALKHMKSISGDTLRSLKAQTACSVHVGILKLQHAIRREDLTGADHYLSQLKAMPNVESEHQFAIDVLQIKLQMKRGNLTEAMLDLDAASKKLDAQQPNVADRVTLMILKTRIWDRAAKPQKAFSIALRACSIAYEARFLLGLWPAVIALCQILNALGEFKAARDLLISCMPQILTSRDCESSALAYSALADAQMGLAGLARNGSLKRKEEMTKCLEYLDRAFDDFSALEDSSGQCEMLAKRASIMHLNGDHVLANDLSAKYLDIKEKNREEVQI